jgi:uncharacterized membrane protein YebE (DUF533 family)
MAGFSDLVGSFMQSAMSSSGGGRIGSALENLQQSGLSLPGASGGSGGDLLGGLLGAVQEGLNSAAQNPVQAGGLGAIVGSVLGGGKGAVGGAVGGGLLAMLGGVAIKALQSAASGAGQDGAAGSYASAPTEAPVGLRAPRDQAETDALESKAKLVLKGMINAAKSDGQISPAEMQRIVDKMHESGADAEVQQWIMLQMQAPLDVAAFAAEIPDTEVAAEVYAASLLAIEVDTDAERRYLDQLAAATGLHPLVVAQIRQTLGVVG